MSDVLGITELQRFTKMLTTTTSHSAEPGDQREMPGVQRAHGRHQADRATGGPRLVQQLTTFEVVPTDCMTQTTTGETTASSAECASCVASAAPPDTQVARWKAAHRVPAQVASRLARPPGQGGSGPRSATSSTAARVRGETLRYRVQPRRPPARPDRARPPHDWPLCRRGVIGRPILISHFHHSAAQGLHHRSGNGARPRRRSLLRPGAGRQRRHWAAAPGVQGGPQVVRSQDVES